MAQAKPQRKVRTRRSYSEEFKQEAVQLLLDGHSAPSVAERLGLAGPNVLYSWKKAILHRAGLLERASGCPYMQRDQRGEKAERNRDCEGVLCCGRCLDAEQQSLRGRRGNHGRSPGRCDEP